jgi:hypothetical protein
MRTTKEELLGEVFSLIHNRTHLTSFSQYLASIHQIRRNQQLPTVNPECEEEK